MKPLMLKMGAFGPFAKEIEIPFSQIGSQGIFLITGETGAGKTTIFDGISFALFGLSSGQNRSIDFLHSDFSKEEEKTYVEFTFLYREQTYVVTRNLAYKKNKTRGQGTTAVGKNAQLLLPDGRAVTGYKQVTEEVEAILGLSWNHFKQIAMIAQGEFLNLLFADTKERSEILRKVFGTGIYLDFQNRLRTMAIEQYKKCEETDRSFIQYLTGILLEDNGEEGSEEYALLTDFKKTKDIHKIQAIVLLLDRVLAEDGEKQKILEKEYKVAQKELETNIVQYTNGEKVNYQFVQLEKELEKEQLLRAKELEVEDIKKQLVIGKNAYYKVAPIERAYLLAKEEKGRIIEKLALDKVQIIKEQERWEDAQEKNKETKADEEQRKMLEEDLTRWELEQKRFDDLSVLEEEKKSRLKQRNHFEEVRLQWIEEANLLEKEYNKGIQQLESLKGVETKDLEISHACTLQKQILEKLQGLKKDQAQYETERKKLINFQQGYQKIEEQYKKATEQYQAQEILFFGAQAGIIASKLTKEMPCPVCGSTHHPKLASLEEAVVTQEELERNKEKLQKLQGKVVDESNQCHMQKERMEQVRKLVQKGMKDLQIQDKKETSTETSTQAQIEAQAEEETQTQAQAQIKAQIEEALTCAQEKYKQLEEERAIFIQQKIEQEQLSKKQQELELKRIHFQEQKEIIHNKVEEVERAYQLVEGKMQLLEKDLSFSNREELQQCIKEATTKKKKLQDKIEQTIRNLQEAEKSLSNANVIYEADQLREKTAAETEKLCAREYKTILEVCKFKEEKEYKEALQDESKLQEFEKISQEYDVQVVQNKTLLEQLTENTKGKKIEELSKLEEEKKTLSEKIRSQESILREMHNRRATNEKIKKEISRLQEKQGAAKEEYLTILKLSKVANGETRGRIAFEQYVQAFYFNQIIQAANKRFHEMTNGQFELVRRQDASDRRSLNGLELDVMDYYTGRKRPVKSLSGGESFKASLSLALGLSDMIQGYAGGIKVDTLFIDEGFGALDEESLEQAMQTLHKLADGNRLVGVISHVSELKEKIEKKIIITKTMEGSAVQMM